MSSHITYQGQPAIQVAILDITKRKATELALQESEAQLHLFAETVDEVFWMLSADESELLFVNPAYETLTGLSCQSAYEDPVAWMQLIHPEDQQHILNEQRQSGAGISIEYRDQEFRLVQPEGRLKWVWLRSWPIFNAQGEIVARAGVAVDISQRKEMEETLSYAAAIIHSSDDAIIGKDLVGTIVSWNPGAERIYGYSIGEVIGQNISLLVPSDRPDEVPAILKRIKQGESVDHYETVRRR
jgi:PAS domain S-box-containing protein